MKAIGCMRGLILAGMALLLVSATVRAADEQPATQPGPDATAATTRPGRGGGPLVRLKQNLDKLDLTDQQKTQIDTLLDQTKQKVTDAIAQAQGDRDTAREQIKGIMQDFRTQLKQILTSDQLAQLKQMHGGGHGHGNDTTPPPPPPGN